MSHLSKLQTAELDWELVDGIEVPISKQFGDVYFSKDNGLLETRHVFLNGNDLTERLSQLNNYQYFCVGETGFGTGLNILTLWQLWQQIRPNNHSHLHVISVEKFPLSKANLIRALNVWTELKPFAEKLITSADSLFAAASKEIRVRVESSAKRFTIVRPRKVGSFLTAPSLTRANSFAVSKIDMASALLTSAIDRRWRITAQLLRY